MSKPSQTGNIAQYSKCGLNHPQPVEVRCRRNINESAPVLTDVNDDQLEQHSPRVAQQVGVGLAAGSTAPDASVGFNTPNVSQVESKLDIILRKAQDLESKIFNRNRNSKSTRPQ